MRCQLSAGAELTPTRLISSKGISLCSTDGESRLTPVLRFRIFTSPTHIRVIISDPHAFIVGIRCHQAELTYPGSKGDGEGKPARRPSKDHWNGRCARVHRIVNGGTTKVDQAVEGLRVVFRSYRMLKTVFVLVKEGVACSISYLAILKSWKAFHTSVRVVGVGNEIRQL